MADHIRISEPDENRVRYPRIEITKEDYVKKNTEMPETKINHKKQRRENLTVSGFLLGGIIISLGGPLSVKALDASHYKKSFRNNSYKVSMLEWELKSVVGEDYVKLRSNGTLETYTPSFFGLKKQVELVDSNLDGLVDVIKIFNDNPFLKSKFERDSKQIGNTLIFEKADQKYRQYREQLADLIAKAEKEWSEQEIF